MQRVGRQRSDALRSALQSRLPEDETICSSSSTRSHTIKPPLRTWNSKLSRYLGVLAWIFGGLFRLALACLSSLHGMLVGALKEQDDIKCLLDNAASYGKFSSADLATALKETGTSLPKGAYGQFGLLARGAWLAGTQVVLDQRLLSKSTDAVQFLEEALLLQLLSAPHPNVCSFLGSCVEARSPAHVWACPLGGCCTLRRSISENLFTLATWSDRLLVAQQLLSATDHLLALGLATRNLSTNSILVWSGDAASSSSSASVTQCRLMPACGFLPTQTSPPPQDRSDVRANTSNDAAASIAPGGAGIAAPPSPVTAMARDLALLMTELMTAQACERKDAGARSHAIATAVANGGAGTLCDVRATPLLDHALAGPLLAGLVPLLVGAPSVASSPQRLRAHISQVLLPAAMALHARLQALTALHTRTLHQHAHHPHHPQQALGPVDTTSPSAPLMPGQQQHGGDDGSSQSPSAPMLPGAAPPPAWQQQPQVWAPSAPSAPSAPAAPPASSTPQSRNTPSQGPAGADPSSPPGGRDGRDGRDAPGAPRSFVCPLSLELMEDPVVACDGFTYEREAISAWLARKAVSPMTNLPLPSVTLVPNHTLRSLISDWRERQRGAACHDS